MNHELNALVAEHIMGWSKLLNRYWTTPDTDPAQNLYSLPQNHELPDFSGNIADAWLVVEKMYNKGRIPGCHYLRLDNNGTFGPWRARFFTAWDNDEDEEQLIVVSSAPECICRAALKAVGVEVPV